MAAYLAVYSGGLHHIQVPGELLPTPFKTVRVRMEMIDIPTYKEDLKRDYPDLKFRGAVIADLTRRRDEYCPTEDENEEFRNEELGLPVLGAPNPGSRVVR